MNVPQDNPLNSRIDVIASMNHVSRFFENPGFVRALTNVSFEVQRGEIFGVLGPKGSGKSTALRILAGQLSTSEGKARVFGRSPRRRSVKSRTGYLPQGDRATPNFLARMLAFVSQLFPKARAETAANSALTILRRRANLAQILAKAPDLIILDDPFLDLDPASCGELEELFLALVRRGKTIILSGDSLCETKDICTRMAVLYAGTVQAIGTLPELLANSEAIRFTAPLLPAATAETVIKIVRNDLLTPTARGAATQIECIQENHRAPSSKLQRHANELLTPLLKKEVSLSLEPAVPPIQIDHDKLASLTRPTEP